jgi:hypothetical protein
VSIRVIIINPEIDMKNMLLGILLLLASAAYSSERGEWKHVHTIQNIQNGDTIPARVIESGYNPEGECWALVYYIGDGYKFYKSYDLGKSWVPVREIFAPGFGSVINVETPGGGKYFLTFVNDRGIMLKTTDDWATIDTVGVEVNFPEEYIGEYKIYMKNPSEGHLFFFTDEGDDNFEKNSSINKIAVTGNGWDTYDIREIPGEYNTEIMEEIDTLSDGRIRFLYDNKKIIAYDYTTNEWENLSELEFQIWNLMFVDDSYGFAIKEQYEDYKRYQSIYVTTDGGKTFSAANEVEKSEKILKLSSLAGEIDFRDYYDGTAIDRSDIYMTNNGGSLWWCYTCGLYDRDGFLKKTISKLDVRTSNSLFWADSIPVMVLPDGQVYRFEGDFFKIEKFHEKIRLIKPVDKSEISPFEIDFYWEKIFYSDEYRFQLALDKNFDNIYVDSTLNEFQIFFNYLYNNKRYYWRVGYKRLNEFIWSDTFYVDMKIPKIENVFPDCGAEIRKRYVELRWETIKGADYYSLMVKLDTNSYTNYKYVYEIDNGRYNLGSLEFNTTYFWRVRTSFPIGGKSEWSDFCHFTTMKNPSSVVENPPDLQIYPNPADDRLVIEALSVMQKAELIDILGISRIYKVNGTHAEINISDYRPGVYFLKVELSGGREIVEKVVVR